MLASGLIVSMIKVNTVEVDGMSAKTIDSHEKKSARPWFWKTVARLGLIVGLLVGIASLFNLIPWKKSETLAITSPVNGAIVKPKDEVCGIAPNLRDGEQLYILVTGIDGVTRYVQDNPFTFSDDSVSTSAYFGSSRDSGKSFKVQAIITKSKLTPGPLNSALII